MSADRYDVIIIGAGAAGLFCAFNSGQRGRRVLVLDHATKVGKKILMSGGGRCNFTNLNTSPENFKSQNPHFCKSALGQYSAGDFLALTEKHKIEAVEKSPGQFFCKHSSKDILKMLLDECGAAGVKIYKRCKIHKVWYENEFILQTSINEFRAESLVVASGGLSIPTLGASGFGYELAQQFGHEIVETRAALVPLLLANKQLNKIKSLAGVSQRVIVSCKKHSVEDDLLFTHRGLSGPAILKISTDWQYGDQIEINLAPGLDLTERLKKAKKTEQLVVNTLSAIMPKKLARFVCAGEFENLKTRQMDAKQFQRLTEKIQHWKITPSGTEGYKTAEVTCGGVSTENISSKTMQSQLQQNLYFIGEVVDVTGDLGGYNFQWAWSSAWCAAQNL